MTPTQIQNDLIRIYGERFRSRFAYYLGRSPGTVTKWWKQPDKPLPAVTHKQVQRLVGWKEQQP
ncbi:hypothetical protein [Zavarzinella formosa]|uniref:hypothetical protein n=1 Tax=Zavarzinella formosa TaxID=360055 RepID=UPI0002D64332|nr:hypothetical protein [Zavarzinella formosa]